jgi:conjugal transfer/entry exclusion protein
MTAEERLQKLREQLAQVERAILAIQNGAQEYSIGTRRLKRADLSLLYQERNRLEREIEALENGGGIFRVAVFDGR